MENLSLSLHLPSRLLSLNNEKREREREISVVIQGGFQVVTLGGARVSLQAPPGTSLGLCANHKNSASPGGPVRTRCPNFRVVTDTLRGRQLVGRGPRVSPRNVPSARLLCRHHFQSPPTQASASSSSPLSSGVQLSSKTTSSLSFDIFPSLTYITFGDNYFPRLSHIVGNPLYALNIDLFHQFTIFICIKKLLNSHHSFNKHL